MIYRMVFLSCLSGVRCVACRERKGVGGVGWQSVWVRQMYSDAFNLPLPHLFCLSGLNVW